MNLRLAIIMLFVTSFVICISSYLLLRNGQQQDFSDIHSDAEVLAGILSQVSYDELMLGDDSKGEPGLIKYSLSNKKLAYAIMTDASGSMIKNLSAPAISLPANKVEKNYSSTMTEESIKVGDSTESILEFHAPIKTEEEQVVFIRIGYFKPELNISAEFLLQMTQLATPVLFLMLFCFYIMNRQLAPFIKANNKVCELISEQQSSDVAIKKNNNITDFVENLNYFISIVKKQTRDMETIKLDSQTANKLTIFQKRRIESALQALPDGVIIIDETGKATFANQRIETMLGILIKDLIGKQPQDWCDNTQLIAFLSQYHMNLMPIKSTDSIQFSPDAYPEKSISVSVLPLSSSHNTELILGTLIIFKDVSEQTQAGHARDNFIAHVSHELKSPLNVIYMQSELLLDDESNNSSQSINSINIIRDEVERLNLLINDLLNITKIESGNVSLNRQRVKLQDFLNDTFNSATRSAKEKNIITSIDVAHSLSTINVDKDLLRIALNNILSNAIKYSHNGDSVSLIAEEIEDEIQIQITDTGIGMSETDRNHIFEKFYRSESDEVQTQSGHGLGLALTQEIIQLHDGKIKLDSMENKGSTFTITLNKTSTFLEEAISA